MQIRLGYSTALGEAKRQDLNNRFQTSFAMSRDLIPAPPSLPLPRFPSPFAVCIFILPELSAALNQYSVCFLQGNLLQFVITVSVYLSFTSCLP